MKKIIIGLLALVAAGGIFWKSTSKPAVPSTSSGQAVDQQVAKVNDGDWIRGKKDAQIVLIEYGDFQCPSCGAYYPVLKQLEVDYGEKLAVVWREFPLTSIHANAWNAAAAAEAAGKQGKFWEMHDVLFENQKEWTGTGKFEGYAVKIGLDVNKWKTDLSDKGIEEKIRADQSSGIDLDVSGTPTFFVNGKKIGLPGGVEEFKKILDGELAKNPTSPSATLGAQKVHMHFDVAVYIDGKKVDLADDKYMEKSEAVHLHDNNGEVAHIHQKGATLGMFVDSLGLKPDVDPKINDKTITDWRNYQPQDLDRIVFGDGPVTDKACIYSETCPERGTPPSEEGCVGGLDTPCE